MSPDVSQLSQSSQSPRRASEHSRTPITPGMSSGKVGAVQRRPSEVGRAATALTASMQKVGVVPLSSDVAQRAALATEPAPEPGVRDSAEFPKGPRPEQKSGETLRAHEGIQYLGRLADKMFTMGRIDAAVNILAQPLAQLLTAVKAGHKPEPLEVDAAGRYAMRLANETLDARWVDSAVELHLETCRPFRPETADQFAILRSKVPVGSAALLRRYQEKLRGHMAEMNSEDRALSDRVGRLT